MFQFSDDAIIPMVVFAIPIIAISGGMIVAIIRVLGRQRVIELIQRERIAAIERGIDPAKLPALDVSRPEFAAMLDYGRPNSPLRRAQGLLIAGIVTLFAAIGVIVVLRIVVDGADGQKAWAVGMVPAAVGVALLVSAAVVWPRGGRPSSGV